VGIDVIEGKRRCLLRCKDGQSDSLEVRSDEQGSEARLTLEMYILPSTVVSIAPKILLMSAIAIGKKTKVPKSDAKVSGFLRNKRNFFVEVG
jgi:hypothetical protein